MLSILCSVTGCCVWSALPWKPDSLSSCLFTSTFHPLLQDEVATATAMPPIFSSPCHNSLSRARARTHAPADSQSVEVFKARTHTKVQVLERARRSSAGESEMLGEVRAVSRSQSACLPSQCRTCEIKLNSFANRCTTVVMRRSPLSNVHTSHRKSPKRKNFKTLSAVQQRTV